MPSRCAERQARRTRRWELGLGAHQGQQPLAHRLWRLRRDPLLARPDLAHLAEDQALGLDVLGDLAQAHLAQRGQVLDPKEVVEGGVDVLARIDLAGPQAGDQRLGGEVDQDDLIG